MLGLSRPLSNFFGSASLPLTSPRCVRSTIQLYTVHSLSSALLINLSNIKYDPFFNLVLSLAAVVAQRQSMYTEGAKAREVVGSNSARCWTFFFLFFLLSPHNKLVLNQVPHRGASLHIMNRKLYFQLRYMGQNKLNICTEWNLKKIGSTRSPLTIPRRVRSTIKLCTASSLSSALLINLANIKFDPFSNFVLSECVGHKTATKNKTDFKLSLFNYWVEKYSCNDFCFVKMSLLYI